jgi:hypothetical protein
MKRFNAARLFFLIAAIFALEFWCGLNPVRNERLRRTQEAQSCALSIKTDGQP